jgi:hypothetical protein
MRSIGTSEPDPEQISDHAPIERESSAWQRLPGWTKWLIGVLAAWVVTELLSVAWDAVPRPGRAILAILAWPWTPWILFVVLTTALIGLLRSAQWALRETMDVATGAIDGWKEAADVTESKLDTVSNVLRVTSTVLLSLDNLVLASDKRHACEALVKALLVDCQRVLTDLIFRGYVLRPEGEYLRTYVAHQMPIPDHYERQFYIGPDRNHRRGVAGEAYVTRRLQLARMNIDTSRSDRPTFDHEQFVYLDDDNPIPHYRAILCIPIVARRDRCLGVLCLDSEQRDAFDDDDIKEFLVNFSYVLGVVLDLVDKARDHDSSPGAL